MRFASVLALSFALSAIAACQRSPPADGAVEAEAGARSEDDAEPTDRGGSSSSPRASARRDAAPAEDVLPLDPACSGLELSLLGAAADPRCAVSEATFRELTGAAGLVQEARREGDHVVFALVNRGAAPIDVPLRFDDRVPARSFTAIAQVEGAGAGVFALPPPTPIGIGGPVDAGPHLHTARVRLAPGARAWVRLAIDLRPDRRLDRRGDGGLVLAGPTLLHVGQALTPLPAGDPARVVWGSTP